MKLKIALLIGMMLVVVAVPAYATPRSTPFTGAYYFGDDDAYGFVLNTDGGTFDGLALNEAVRDTRDQGVGAASPVVGPRAGLSFGE